MKTLVIDEEARKRLIKRILLPKGEKPPIRVMVLSTDLSDRKFKFPKATT